MDALAELQSQLEVAAADPELPPAERRARLSGIRDRIRDLHGLADRYLADATKAEQSRRSDVARAKLRARELADLREELVEEGFTDEALLEAGVLSHDELNRLDEEGLLEEAAMGLAGKWSEKLHPRVHSRKGGGEFGRKFGSAPPASGGGKQQQEAMIDPRVNDFFRPTPGAIVTSLDRLVPTKKDPPEHIAKAMEKFDMARQGIIPKRKALDVRENGDGTLSIIDGNSSYEVLKHHGITHALVSVGHGPAEQAVVERLAYDLASKAQKIEPEITSTVQSAIEAHGGTMSGLEQRLKSVPSLQSKIRRRMERHPGMDAAASAAGVNDAVRYTALLPSASYTDGVKATMAEMTTKGYKLTDQKNYWGGSDDYDGFHAIYATPDGVNVELQFHTPDSLNVKTKQNHPIYERFRESKDPHERWTLWTQMVDNTKAVKQPPGIETIAPHFEKPQKPQPPAPKLDAGPEKHMVEVADGESDTVGQVVNDELGGKGMSGGGGLDLSSLTDAEASHLGRKLEASGATRTARMIDRYMAEVRGKGG